MLKVPFSPLQVAFQVQQEFFLSVLHLNGIVLDLKGKDGGLLFDDLLGSTL
jgi:hypothetical protein